MTLDSSEEKEPPSSPEPNHSRQPCGFDTTNFFIRPCDVGLGVFASRHIHQGEIILRVWGPVIDFAETKRRGPRECMAIQIGHDRYIDTQAPAVFVNHSCDPNAGIRDDELMVALRDISAGDEIRFDYSTTMEEQSFTMQCLCHSPLCRGLVRDFSTLPPSVKAHYLSLKVVMNFIQAAAMQKSGRSSDAQQNAPAPEPALCLAAP